MNYIVFDLEFNQPSAKEQFRLTIIIDKQRLFYD